MVPRPVIRPMRDASLGAPVIERGCELHRLDVLRRMFVVRSVSFTRQLLPELTRLPWLSDPSVLQPAQCQPDTPTSANWTDVRLG
jgi:hypothetical protein